MAKKAAEGKFNGQITRARDFLKNCTSTEEEYRRNISLVLDRAEKELTLNDNYTGSSGLYRSVLTDVLNCQSVRSDVIIIPDDLIPPDVPITSVINPTSSPLEASPFQIVQFIVLPLVAPILAAVFGLLWYRTSKKQSQERKSK